MMYNNMCAIGKSVQCVRAHVYVRKWNDIGFKPPLDPVNCRGARMRGGGMSGVRGIEAREGGPGY